MTIAASSLIWISCGKENLTDNNNSTQKSKVIVENPSNPFDFKGEAHNRMLMEFIEDVILTDVSDSRDSEIDVYETVFDYFNIDEEGRTIISTFRETAGKDVANFNEQEMSMYLEKTPQYEKYLDIKNILEDSNLNLQAKINSIIDIENEIANSSFDGDTKEILLTATSIGRYSMQFWAPESMGGLGYFDELNIQLASNVDWWGVARTDIYGAALSGFTTANPFVALGWGAASSALDALDGALS